MDEAYRRAVLMSVGPSVSTVYLKDGVPTIRTFEELLEIARLEVELEGIKKAAFERRTKILAAETAGITKAETLQPAMPKATSKRHKLRTNSLDSPIEKAVNNAGSKKTAAVYVQLRELAINQEIPFTGITGDNSLSYTGDDGTVKELTKRALGKRLKNL